MRDLSPLEIEKWYAVAVGEVGIPPTDFYDMTEEEMEWAYTGYKQRQQDLANIILLVFNRAQSNRRNEQFRFTDDKGYRIGSLKERDDTFSALGIEEGLNVSRI